MVNIKTSTRDHYEMLDGHLISNNAEVGISRKLRMANTLFGMLNMSFAIFIDVMVYIRPGDDLDGRLFVAFLFILFGLWIINSSWKSRS